MLAGCPSWHSWLTPLTFRIPVTWGSGGAPGASDQDEKTKNSDHLCLSSLPVIWFKLSGFFLACLGAIYVAHAAIGGHFPRPALRTSRRSTQKQATRLVRTAQVAPLMRRRRPRTPPVFITTIYDDQHICHAGSDVGINRAFARHSASASA